MKLKLKYIYRYGKKNTKKEYEKRIHGDICNDAKNCGRNIIKNNETII